jgi:hypothetical protein
LRLLENMLPSAQKEEERGPLDDTAGEKSCQLALSRLAWGLLGLVSDELLTRAPLGVTLASPKSRILACPRLVTNRLAGLMSRWMIPSLWAASRGFHCEVQDQD